MRAVDTNLIVRLIARDEPGQASAAEEFIKNGAWVSQVEVARKSGHLPLGTFDRMGRLLGAERL
jgi:hypothetical protein